MFYLLPHIDVFARLFILPFDASNSETHALFIRYIGVQERGRGALFCRGLPPHSTPRKIWTCERLKMASGRS
jgi:hypothetical protein